MYKYYISLNFILLYTVISNGQNSSEFTNVINALIEYNIKDAQIILNKKPKSDVKSLLQWNINTLKFGIKDTIVLDNSNNSYIYKSLKYLKDGDIYKYLSSNNDSIAFDNYRKSLINAQRKKDTLLIRYSYHKILPFIFKNREFNNGLSNFLTDYVKGFKDYIQTTTDSAIYHYYTTIKNISNKQSYVKDYIKISKTLESTNNRYLEGLYYQMIGVQKSAISKQPDSSIYYYKKAATCFEKVQGVKRNINTFATYNNIAISLDEKGSYQEALEYHRKTQLQSVPENNYLHKAYHYQAIAITFRNLNMHDSAYHYLEKEKKEIAILRSYTNTNKLQEIEVKYETAEKEKQILIEQQKKERIKNVALGLGGSLALASIIAFLLFKNTKRKQKLAEQDKELETQKLVTLLKEQELTTIDAMIEGQEKERQRIANDLHDDLGGLMTTVKWHFDALKEKKSKELFEKTNMLLDEAYQKIRSIAHAKNSGVIAKQGLLKAINQMAEKISALNKIHIEVIDHGLENRLENSLELTIFRIIQELIANIIKHANATEATIHITNHHYSLNLMIEDNGKGFNPSQITKTNKGMGISSIDKRIEHLNGKLTIESEINKGTTIIIDIPI